MTPLVCSSIRQAAVDQPGRLFGAINTEPGVESDTRTIGDYHEIPHALIPKRRRLRRFHRAFDRVFESPEKVQSGLLLNISDRREVPGQIRVGRMLRDAVTARSNHF